jgi:hypothetical protein
MKRFKILRSSNPIAERIMQDSPALGETPRQISDSLSLSLLQAH